MPHISKMFHSRWLKAPDIGDAELKATMRAVTLEEFEDREKGESENKWVMWFKGAEKGLILNKTNASQVGDHYGPETDEWVGRQVTLFTMDVEAFGKITNAIRIKVTPENVAAQGNNGEAAAAQPQQPPAPQPVLATELVGDIGDNLPF